MARKIVFLIIFCILGFSVFSRSLIAQKYNFGNLWLLRYLLLDADKDSIEMQRAENEYLKIENSSLSNDRLNWRLSLVAYEQDRFNEAVEYFLKVRKLALPDYLLTEQSTGVYSSYIYHQLDALASEKTGDTFNAMQSYRYALVIDPREWPRELYERYYGLMANMEDSEMQMLGERLRDYLLGEERNETRFAQSQEMTSFLPVLPDDDMAGCWELQQIRYDRTAIELGPLVPLQLRWQHASDPTKSYTESLIVANLAPNAGFEWGEEDGIPIGYPSTIYTEDNIQENHQLLTGSVFSETTNIAGLINSQQYYNSSYASNAIPIDSRKLYFQGGWLKSDDGQAYMGHYWGDLEGLERRYQYVIGGIAENNWTFYGKIMTIPPQAEQVDLWLLNFNTTGAAYFDDLLFFEVAIPDCHE